MQSDQYMFNAKDIEGVSNAFNVRLKLNATEKLEIYLQNRDSYQSYFLVVKNEDIKKQNIKTHSDFIENAIELFQYIGFSLSQLGEFADVIKVDSKGKVTIKLQIKIDFRQGSKRKMVTYEFQTVKQSVNAIQKLRNQFNTLTIQKQKFEKDIFKRVEELQNQNKRLKQQLQHYQRSTSSKESQLLKYSSNKEKLIFNNSTLLHTSNNLNIVLIGQKLTLQSVYEWKIRICNKMVLIFGVTTPEVASLQNNALEEAIQKQKCLTKEYLNGQEIITFVFEQGQLKYIVEKVDIEEDEGSSPQPNYNMKRGSFMCKKLGKVDNIYACFGLHLGARIEILSYIKKK